MDIKEELDELENNHDKHGAFRGTLRILQNMKEAGQLYGNNARFGDIVRRSHVFFCEDKLTPALLHTKNKIAYRPAPFETQFIDDVIKINEWYILGALVIITKKEEIPEGETFMGGREDTIGISFVATTEETYSAKEDSMGFVHVQCFITKNKLVRQKHPTFIDEALSPLRNQQLVKSLIQVEKQLAEYVCNFLDFVNMPSTQIIIQKENPEQTAKRERRGKAPIPTTAIIRLSKEHKTHLKKLNEHEKMNYSHQFWVRGHWRHYTAERYKNETIWITPYIKGEGILIQKAYKVEERRG